MITRRSILGFFVVLLGVVLLIGQTSASSINEEDLGALIGEEFLTSLQLEPMLSSDGKAVHNGVPIKVFVADPNPSRVQIRVPAPVDLAQATESATASFSITYIPAGGTDIRGETCYAFPENAKAAFNAAANVWANLERSSVPITIKACWASLSSASTLGYSGGGTIHRDFANAPRANTWYSQSLANSLAGYNLDPSNVDMHITYNLKFNWFFGTDGNTPSDQYDFMSVVLHEICHGLNFAGSMQYSGGWAGWGYDGSPNIYDTFVKDGSGNSLINTGVYPNPSTALGSAVKSNNLWFYGTNAVAANGGNPVKIYAPSTWISGSSYSHLDYNTFSGTVNRLMVWAISNGDSIHDPGPVTKGLLADLGWKGGPGATTLISPSGPITTTTPTYSWNAVKDSSHYLLWVNGPSGNVIQTWYTAAAVGCPDGTGTCYATPAKTLALGSHRWWVQTWNASGYGPWSGSLDFVLGLATLISPSGPITTPTPIYSWNPVKESTDYYLWVRSQSGDVIKKWYTSTEANCADGISTCSVTPSTVLGFGTHSWWIQTYNSAGYGPWSAAKEFSIGTATLISPSGPTATPTPTYTWNTVTGSTWYYLYVSGPSGVVINRWYKTEELSCNDTTCSVTPSTALALGNYKWWIQTYNATGYGPWSAAKDFAVGVVTLISPSGTIGTGTPQYSWSFLADATWYRLYVNGPSGSAVIDQWYTTANAHCGAETCWVDSPKALGNGNYTWWIQTYNSGGYGPWSASATFQVNGLTSSAIWELNN
jgi:hypothetical protein